MQLILQIAAGLLLGAYALRTIEYLRGRWRDRAPRRFGRKEALDLALGLAVVAAITQIVYRF